MTDTEAKVAMAKAYPRSNLHNAYETVTRIGGPVTYNVVGHNPYVHGAGDSWEAALFNAAANYPPQPPMSQPDAITLTFTPESARARAALIAEQGADSTTLTERIDATALRVLVEDYDATRALVATLREEVASLKAALAPQGGKGVGDA